MNTPVADFVRRVTAPEAELLARVQNPDETTARILDAARSQFEMLGIRRSTMDDVARRSRLGRATVYRRFPTKELLVDAVVFSEVQRYFAGYVQARGRASTFAERNNESTIYTLRFLRGNTLLNRLMDTEPETLLPHLTVDAAPLIDLICQQSSTLILAELCSDRAPTPVERRTIETVAELHARLALSFILTRDTRIDLESDQAAREFGQQYLTPMAAGIDDTLRARPGSG